MNAAIHVAAEPWRSQVRVIDSGALLQPRGYQDALEIDGERRIVRTADGMHLNEAGAELLADAVLDRLSRDFVY